MSVENSPEVRVDDLMREIREELARGNAVRPPPVHVGSSASARVSLPRLPDPDAVPPAGEASSLSALTDLHDEPFIDAAYRTILKRAPDAAGRAHYVGLLRSGRITKIEILGRLRYSSEGRKQARPMRGLLPRFALWSLFRVPLLGYLVSLVYTILRLPRIVRNMQGIEQFTARGDANLARHVNHLSGSIEQMRADDLANARASAHSLGSRIDALNVSIDNHEDQLGKLHADLAQAVSLRQEVTALGRSLLDQERRLTALLKAQPGEAATPAGAHVVDSRKGESLPDSFYVNFEDYFRGEPSEVKRRLCVYLPRVLDVVSDGGLVVDIGCGRGEWLELMRENGIDARGLDVNSMMVEECRGAGLTAEQGDVFDYLRTLADDSVACMTGFHIIEHIPFPTIIDLFDEVYRVLRPGGIVIFETPNPENVTVGSYNFYYDPTHANPLPPGLVKYYAESRGFDRVEIQRVNADLLPNPFADMTVDETPLGTVTSFLSERFYAAPDYALVARKS